MPSAASFNLIMQTYKNYVISGYAVFVTIYYWPQCIVLFFDVLNFRIQQQNPGLLHYMVADVAI